MSVEVFVWIVGFADRQGMSKILSSKNNTIQTLLVSAIHGNNGLSPKQDITISQQEQETILNQNPTKTGTVQGIPCHAGWSL